MSNPITQAFAIEILMTTATPSDIDSGNDANSTVKIAPALSEAITQWEREFNEEDDEEDGEGFLVEDKADDDDADDGDGDEDEGDYVVDVSDSVLNLTVGVTPEVLRDIKVLQDIDADERLTLRVIYGTAPDTLVRQFTIGPDIAILLSEGNRVDMPEEKLEIVVVADVYDSETIF